MPDSFLVSEPESSSETQLPNFIFSYHGKTLQYPYGIGCYACFTTDIIPPNAQLFPQIPLDNPSTLYYNPVACSPSRRLYVM